MQAVMRSCVMTGAALAGASLITMPPVAPAAAPHTDLAVQLTAGLEDLGNVPLNLFYDIVNVPANWFNAVQEFANSLFFGGPWLVPSATNVWGFDVGDPPKVQAFIDMLLPFPALSKPLGEQISGLLEAWMPTNTACDTFWCFGSPELWGGYFQVPLSQLQAGYTFPETGPTVIDPHGAVEGAFGFDGTHIAPDGSDVYPWAGTTFTLDLAKPFTDFFNSLLAAPSDNPIVAMPNIFTVFSDLFQSLYVAVNFFLPGGPFIPEAVAFDWDGLLSLDWGDLTTSFDGLWSDLGAIWANLLP